MLLRDAFTGGQWEFTRLIRVGDTVIVDEERWWFARTGDLAVSIVCASSPSRYIRESLAHVDSAAEAAGDSPLRLETVKRLLDACFPYAIFPDGSQVCKKAEPRKILVGQELNIDGLIWHLMQRSEENGKTHLYAVCCCAIRDVLYRQLHDYHANEPISEHDLKALLGPWFDHAELV